MPGDEEQKVKNPTTGKNEVMLLSDPFALVKLRNDEGYVEFKSSVISSSINPEWKEKVDM